MHAYRDQYAQLFHLGRGVVLIAISPDPVEELSSWARDDEFPFLMASDTAVRVGESYGAFYEREGRKGTNRTLFVIGPDGRIAYVAAPFRQLDPTAYEELAAAIDRLAPPEPQEDGPDAQDGAPDRQESKRVPNQATPGPPTGALR